MTIDFKYVLKRVIIGVLIALIIMFLKGQLLLVANASTLNPSSACLYLPNTQEACGVAPISAPRPLTSSDTGLGVNVWFQDTTLLQTGGSYFIEFRATVLGNGQSSPYNSLRLFTGNNGDAGSAAAPDRDNNLTFYQITDNTYQIVWSFGIDSFSNFNTLRFSWFSEMQSFNGMIAGLQSATLSITSGSSGNDSSSDTSNIINNQNQNSQNIINNQNNNTQNIINNNNSNTQEIIDNQNAIAEQQEKNQEVCNIINKDNIYTTGKKLNSDGTFSTSGAYGITDFIKLGKSLTRTASSGGSSAYFCWYDSNKSLISCMALNTIPNGLITPPSNATYFRTSIDIGNNVPQFKLCKNGNQAIEDSLNDDSISGDTGNDFFDNFNYGDDSLSSVITAPLRLFNKMTDTCQPIRLTWLNTNIDIPCGDTIFWNRQDVQSFRSFWNILFGGVALYYLGTKLYKVVHDAIDPQKDNIESVGV